MTYSFHLRVDGNQRAGVTQYGQSHQASDNDPDTGGTLENCMASKAYILSSGDVVFKQVAGKKRCCQYVFSSMEVALRANCKN